ncbi:MAG: UbiA family prenyltransferase [Dehalobacterium sp.]
MRLYYAFITGIAGWLGVVYYEFSAGYSAIDTEGLLFKKFIILVLLFLSWGINQIINDFLGLKEDRINAPERPMVTGELAPKKAILTSIVLLIISLIVIGIYLEPIAIVPALLGVFLNILYEYAKGYGVLGNIVFGLMIMMCPVVGFFALGPLPHYLPPLSMLLLGFVALLNALMTFYTFFKDYQGDKAAQKKTIVVKYGIEKSRFIALGAAFIPAMLFALVYFSGKFPLELNTSFIFLGVLTFFLQIWTGVLYYKYPSGERTYYSLSINFRACSCGQAALIALFDPMLGMMVFIAAYLFVGFLFDLHANSKA